MRVWAYTIVFLSLSLSLGDSAQQCGKAVGDALCPGGLCCSEYGYCGDTDAYCGEGCQSQCDGGDGGDGNLSDIIPESLFETMFPKRNAADCHAIGFYTYDAFISAAKEFPEFGNTGSNETRKREIAAFFGQTSHETTGGIGWDPPPSPFYWGYCYKREIDCQPRCQASTKYPCAPGKLYCGRGPIQISWNYNYGQCGDALKLNLLQEPELVETDPIISFKAALWFWMTKQSPKPSCHDVVTDNWTPTNEDSAANRAPGYGVITNIINGGYECGKGPEGDPLAANEDRIGFYERYCGLLDIDPGVNLDCYYQQPFGSGLLTLKDTM